MPSPRRLKVGDRIRFVSLPEEWNAPGFYVHKSTVISMKALIRRGRWCRVSRLRTVVRGSRLACAVEAEGSSGTRG